MIVRIEKNYFSDNSSNFGDSNDLRIIEILVGLMIVISMTLSLVTNAVMLIASQNRKI